MLETLIFAGYSSEPQEVYYQTENLSCESDLTRLKSSSVPWLQGQCREKDDLTVVWIGFLEEDKYLGMTKSLNISQFIVDVAEKVNKTPESIVIRLYKGTRADELYASCYETKCYKSVSYERGVIESEYQQAEVPPQN